MSVISEITGRPTIHIADAIEQSASGDPYWHSPRMQQQRDIICRQIAAEYRELEERNRVLQAGVDVIKELFADPRIKFVVTSDQEKNDG